MDRPPRPPRPPILAAGLWQRVVRISLVLSAVTLGVAVWADHAGRPWQSMAFFALGAAQLGVAIGSRSRPRTWANPLLPIAVAAALGLQVAGLYLPALRDLLKTVPLSATELLTVAALSVLGFAAVVADRRLHPGPPPTPARTTDLPAAVPRYCRSPSAMSTTPAQAGSPDRCRDGLGVQPRTGEETPCRTGRTVGETGPSALFTRWCRACPGFMDTPHYVDEVMTSPVIAVHPGIAADDTARDLVRRRIGAVPVVDPSQRVLGVVAESDVPADRGSLWTTAHDVMSSPAVTVATGSTVDEAWALLTERGIGRLPVVDPTTGWSAS